MQNKLIAKQGRLALYFDSIIDTPWGTEKYMGRVVREDGKHTSVDIDDTLGRSDWNVLEPNWRRDAKNTLK